MNEITIVSWALFIISQAGELDIAKDGSACIRNTLLYVELQEREMCHIFIYVTDTVKCQHSNSQFPYYHGILVVTPQGIVNNKLTYWIA